MPIAAHRMRAYAKNSEYPIFPSAYVHPGFLWLSIETDMPAGPYPFSLPGNPAAFGEAKNREPVPRLKRSMSKALPQVMAGFRPSLPEPAVKIQMPWHM